MSLSIDDDWLKTAESQNEDQRDMGHSSSVTGGMADLHLPADLQMPDFGRWWVDLEFLDLASGPPANYSSANQDRNKNKNPTLGYNFPDIFFDTTSSASLFGSSVDDSHRFDRYVGESFKDHGLDFEKGLLADLFPSSTVVQPTEKLLDDLDLVPPAQSSNSNNPPISNEVQSTSQSGDSSNQRSLGKQGGKDEDDDIYRMSPDVLQSISKNFPELEQEFDKVASSVDIVSGDPTKINEFKLSVDVSAENKALKQFFQLTENKIDKGSSGNDDDDIYSVPPEVLHSMSKNFSDLQQEFDKVATSVVNESGDLAKINDFKQGGDGTSENRLRRYLRIKSVRSFSGHPSIKTLPPKGTVARISIQTDKRQNATIFSITPSDSDDPEQSFTVHTSNLSEAKNLVRPLHLDKLPIFKRILSNLIPSAKLKHKKLIEEQEEEKNRIKNLDEKLILEFLAENGVHLSKLESTENEQSYLWLCPDCSLGIKDPCEFKEHVLGHRNASATFPATAESRISNSTADNDVIFTDQDMRDIHSQRIDTVKNKTEVTGIQVSKSNCDDLPETGSSAETSLPLCPDCHSCFEDTEQLKQHLTSEHNVQLLSQSCDNLSNDACNIQVSSKVIDIQVPAAFEAEKKEFICQMAEFGIHLENVDCVFTTDSKNKRSWLCPDCDKGYPKKSLLKEHLFQHRNVKPYPCLKPGCTWAFFTSFKLKRHQNTVHSQQTTQFSCNMLGCETRTFTTVFNLNQHLKKHDRPTTFECKLCPCKFQIRNALEAHKRLHPEYLGEYQCSECPRKLLSSEDLSKHNRIHSVVKNQLVCLEQGCGKAFKKPSLLKSHSLIHTGYKPFHCQFEGCQWSFRTVSKLRRHEKVHKNERKHVCRICDKAYLRPEHLRGHMISIHNNIRFACPLQSCEARFTAKSSLYSHMKKHKEGQASKHFYRCVIETCGLKFENRKLLSQHVSQNHETELGSGCQYGQLVSKQPSMDLGDDQEVDFIALLSSVGEDISIKDSTIEGNSIQDLSIQNCTPQEVPDDNLKINLSEEAVMTDVMSLVLPNQPGQVFTVRTTEDISNLVKTGFEQLASVDVETDIMSGIEPRPKDLITVDTSAITPVKNGDTNFVRNQLVPKRKLNHGKFSKNITSSLLKSKLSSAKASSMMTVEYVKQVDVVIVPEGFIGDFSQDEM